MSSLCSGTYDGCWSYINNQFVDLVNPRDGAVNYTLRGTDSSGLTHIPEVIYPSAKTARTAAQLFYERFPDGDVIMEYVDILNSRGAVFDTYGIANVFAGGGYPAILSLTGLSSQPVRRLQCLISPA